MFGDHTLHLIYKAKNKDPDAFVELMTMYQKDMFRTAMAILKNEEDSADAIQDTILSCWSSMDSLRNIKYFKTWMTRILINHCYDIRKRYVESIEVQDYEIPVTYNESNLELYEALGKLDEKYRVPVVLYYGNEYKIREISDIMGLPLSTVKTRLARGRKQLAAYYREEDGNGSL